MWAWLDKARHLQTQGMVVLTQSAWVQENGRPTRARARAQERGRRSCSMFAPGPAGPGPALSLLCRPSSGPAAGRAAHPVIGRRMLDKPHKHSNVAPRPRRAAGSSRDGFLAYVLARSSRRSRLSARRSARAWGQPTSVAPTKCCSLRRANVASQIPRADAARSNGPASVPAWFGLAARAARGPWTVFASSLELRAPRPARASVVLLCECCVG